jgi:hypothetical protein
MNCIDSASINEASGPLLLLLRMQLTSDAVAVTVAVIEALTTHAKRWEAHSMR